MTEMHYIMIIGRLEVFVGDDSRIMSSPFSYLLALPKENAGKGRTSFK